MHFRFTALETKRLLENTHKYTIVRPIWGVSRSMTLRVRYSEDGDKWEIDVASNHLNDRYIWWGVWQSRVTSFDTFNRLCRCHRTNTVWSLIKSTTSYKKLLGESHCWWTNESLRAHVAKFYGRLRLIRNVLRASKFSVLIFTEIVI